MHVVQALAALSVGGSEFVATELTEALRRQHHQVTVLAAPGPLSQRVEAAGAATLPWPVNRKRLGTLRYIGRIRRWLSEARPDIVHVHSRLPALLVWRALVGMPEETRPALVTTMHGHYSVSRYSGLMARGDAVIAVSDAIRQYTLHNYPVAPERVHLIHGGADPGPFPSAIVPIQRGSNGSIASIRNCVIGAGFASPAACPATRATSRSSICWPDCCRSIPSCRPSSWVPGDRALATTTNSSAWPAPPGSANT
jgi:glycosyltransferase involved in cell wall biosynthesis